MLGRSVTKVLLKVEPIFGLRQLIFFKINQFISSLFQDFFDSRGIVPQRFKLALALGLMVKLFVEPFDI